MNNDQEATDKPLLIALPEGSGDLASAWTELFRLGIRYARLARYRAGTAGVSGDSDPRINDPSSNTAPPTTDSDLEQRRVGQS